MSEPKPSLEPLLVPDLEMQRQQAVSKQTGTYAECPRRLNERGRLEALSWFGANYEPDPSLREDGWAISSSFLAQYADGPDAHNAFVEALRSVHPLYEGDHVLVGPLLDAKIEPSFRVRRRTAGFEIRSGHLHASKNVDWHIYGVLPRASVCAIAAPPGDGKTWMALSMAKAVAYGEPWMGRVVVASTEHPRCLYVDYENGADEIARRLKVLGDGDGRVSSISFPDFGLGDDRTWRAIEDFRPELVVFDTYASAFRGIDEKDSRFAQELLRMSEYSQKHETTFIPLVHSPKATGTESLVEIVRGSSAIAAALDAAYFVKKVSRFATKDPKERRSIVVCKKMRRGGDEPAPFTVKLTDAGGLELHEERRGKAPSAAPMSDEDAIYESVKANPGTGGTRGLAASTGIPAERVLIARRRLLDAERIENRGSAKRPELYAR